MTIRLLQTVLVASSLFTLAVCSVQVQAEDAPKSIHRSIYDESADGSKQIADALVIAKKEHKHIFLQFGANWCGWCRRLHGLLQTNKSLAETLKSNYVVVLIDVNEEHNKAVDARYGHPTQFGLPAIVVLNADGKQLTTQDTARLEEGDHYSLEKLKAILDQWAPRK